MLRFDRSLLPAAQLEFVVIADTHYMIDPGDAPLEFESRRHQSERGRTAWQMVAALEPVFVVHLGDLVQEFPGRPGFERAQQEALEQIDAAGLRQLCRFVAGNHDVGDKPDPTMPTEDVTTAGLADWQRTFGPSWSSWNVGGLHFVILNSQILNTGLAAEAEQRSWFETDLAANDDPVVLFLHLPPFLDHGGEAALGHYDNIAEPARSWLLERVRLHDVYTVFAAHVHFRFLHSLGAGRRYWLSPSTSFTRPGYGHLFTSAAAPERGRDDADKIGFLLCRLVDGRLDVHLVRSHGIDLDRGSIQLTPTPVTATGRLGVSSAHVLAPHTQIPIAYPSAVRQPVRNDYPLLGLLELGCERVRVPAADLLDPVQAERLDLLREEGVRVQVTALGEAAARACLPQLHDDDLLELQLPGRLLPEMEAVRELAADGRQIVLCPILPGQSVPGKQHPRTRIGYLTGELASLSELLSDPGISLTPAVRLDGDAPWSAVQALGTADNARDIILLLELPGVDDARNAVAAAFGVVAAAALDATPLLEPLVDLDRTMDVSNGLLDGLCNPRPAFHVARHLAACLAGHPCTPSLKTRSAARIVDLGWGRHLVIVTAPQPLRRLGVVDPTRVLRLVDGVWSGVGTDLDRDAVVDPTWGPLLLTSESDVR
ncbi:MAG TPA: metallophosphoesterase [Candidatus Latescibacteria bacterium]|jgi:hypothetical protein|nr:hypothetical protein [Gemmatimonadaceae bacterium]MDP6015844.1 metallophosphoesterase [Candidatus Latescibacterota bacterium]HJP29157.1 metallophosphoesterase [Candidatus Latescibacterota bacterium]